MNFAPSSRISPWVLRLIAVNAVVLLLMRTIFIAPDLAAALAFSPGDALRAPWTFFTYMFVHAGLLHLLGNMFFLWMFGDNVEDRLGRTAYAAFYLFGGIAAAIGHVLSDRGSIVPVVGASGAVAEVMGAYLVLYPRVRVYTLVPIGFFVTTIALPAWTMLLYWIGLQALGGFTGLFAEQKGGVAFWAHIGGFVAGALLVKLFARPADVAAHRGQPWRPQRLSGRSWEG